ncbi:uncharacterized protein LOC119656542 isoform X4 [Hermetia illucens]|uniref:uncharacterized protein LOC119656542 isoform X4 n=1 Tax=Hermetia illucens TaxID=343691 RepID=UPI0018CBF823|nr:uncharacterized protein LOC119656542 isoform X4 [Hermetia illucens]
MISETILTLIDDVGKDMDKFLHCFRDSIFAKLIYFAWDLFILLQSFLGSFLSKSLKTNQLEVNTDEKTSRAVARLREPRDLFALPKEKDHDCPQQAARWPTECQVLDERVYHIDSVPELPEPYYQQTGSEPRPRPVGEENGIVVFNYNPVSAVNYKICDDDSDGSDSDSSSSETHSPTPEPRGKAVERFIRLFTQHRSSSNSNDEDADEDVYVNGFDDENEDVNNYTKPKKLYSEVFKIPPASYAKTHSILESPLFTCKSQSKSPPKELKAPLQNPPQPQSLEMNAQCTVVDQVTVDDNQESNCSVSPPKHNNSDSFDSNNNSSALRDHSENKNKKKLSNVANENLTQFSRSSVGGSKFLMNVHPYNNNNEDSYNDLEFESRFESGNLAKAVKITPTYYELYLRPDLYTNRHKQWFYFRVSNTRKNTTYRFSIVNLVKPDSLHNEGMRPLMYSTKAATKTNIGWRRCGENIAYYRNDDENSGDEDDENSSYTLTFNIQFPYDEDMVYFAHSYPYTYSDLQDYLMEIQRHPVKSKFCKLRLLCRSLAGNNVYYLTVTAPTVEEDPNKKKRAVVVTARVHPGETPSSWMMKGLMDFITGDSNVAKRLRHKFIFKLIPMLNPDGVIVGNTRCSLTGKDLNRQYRTVIRETYPSIWYTKAMLKRLIEDCGVAMYCDMHAHTRKHNVFIYGCENKKSPDKKLCEQVYPLMLHKNIADKFSFECCKFKIQRSKEGTGRIVMWMLGITNSYTMEASFGGSSLGSRNGTHFTTADYESIGRAFCETLHDYCDDSPVKERLRSKIVERLVKEGSSADEPLNIQLSDYSSDEGDTSSSSSDNEGKAENCSDLEGPCCQPLKVPPCSPVLTIIQRKDEKKVKKKQKTKSSNIHKRSKKPHRTVLELPTTDPGSDLQFSTDDEIYVETDGYGTIPRAHRHHLQNEIQRRLQNEIPQSDQQMPPELIVTPAKHKSIESSSLRLDDRQKQSPPPPALLEFPPIAGTTRRTNSWHNLNKCGQKIRINNTNYIETTENLQFKLSLKKQIWTGVMTDASTYSERNVPLSWGVPPILKKKSLHLIKDDSEALLTACSQKLAAWQQSELKKFQDDEEVPDENGRAKSKNKVTINLVVPDVAERHQKARRSANSSNKMTLKVEQSGSNDPPKHKKRRNPLSRIAETTQILSRLAKAKVKTPSNQKKSSFSSSIVTTTASVSIIPPLAPITKTHHHNKFKTGGIVATAVQPMRKKKIRLMVSTAKNQENPVTESDIDKSHKKVKTKSKRKKTKVSN